MKVGELIQRVQSVYSRGVESDDSRLRPRHIYNKLLTARRLLMNQISKLSDFYQTIYCVGVEKYNGCKCGICEVWRAKVPTISYALGKPLIEYIKGIKGKKKIYIIDSKTDIDGSKYIKERPLAFYENGYIYFLNKVPPRKLIIRAVFDDPVEAIEYYDGCDVCLSAYELEFPINNGYVDKIIELAINELVKVFSSVREDQSSDSKDSINIR